MDSPENGDSIGQDGLFDDAEMMMMDEDETLNGDQNETQNTQNEGDRTAKLKRTACTLCRKRKLKCDGARPKYAFCPMKLHMANERYSDAPLARDSITTVTTMKYVRRAVRKEAMSKHWNPGWPMWRQN